MKDPEYRENSEDLDGERKKAIKLLLQREKDYLQLRIIESYKKDSFHTQ